MQYNSTRNTKQIFTFKEVFLNGLASDGGLYIPKNIPSYSLQDLENLKKLSYEQLAVKIILNYCSDEFNETEIKDLVNRSYKEFREKNVVKIKRFENIILLELFHGPTLAFKDIAMQLIGNMYEKILTDKNNVINIVVATSGDTGAAAISALKGRKNINIFVLHPHNRISKVQRKLMTTVKENNVYNLAIEGNFDDCQKLVKLMFIDQTFNNEINMSGVNSINWVRIIAQIVYYFFSYFKINKGRQKINFSVPTGNFGDVFAGYIAKKMGLPINKLIVATNKNDILKRVISTGVYKTKKVFQTISPSMDIQIASNFERLIFYISSNDDQATIKKMEELRKNNEFKLSREQLNFLKKDFISESLSEEETKSIIKKIYKNYNILIDPHTAVGLGVLDKLSNDEINVILSTAHPGKFPEVIKEVTGKYPELPAKTKKIIEEKEKFNILPNDLNIIKKFIKEKTK
jgi:threonine synthase